MKTILLFILAILIFSNSLAQQTDWSAVEKVFGKKGAVQDGVFKITFPRYDLTVRIGDFNVAPGLALTCWIGFYTSIDSLMISTGNKTIMMGDLVLLDQEVEPVIRKIVDENLEITALHNHIIGEIPAIKYIHFSGSGDPVKLAQEIKAVLSVTGTPLTPPAPSAMSTTPDWSKVEAILGKSGKHNGNLLQYTFARDEILSENDMVMPPYIGMATAINFQLSGDKAAITGDFVLLADEVNQVLRELIKNGISVTAVHNHMLYDDPRLFMMHFWAVDDPEKLAMGLKAALDKTNSKMP